MSIYTGLSLWCLRLSCANFNVFFLNSGHISTIVSIQIKFIYMPHISQIDSGVFTIKAIKC